MSYNRTLLPGEKIRSRWNGKIYQLIRVLGKGANGEVLLVNYNGRKLALKKGEDLQGIALEYRLLKELQTNSTITDKGDRDLRLGPFVYDLDDMVTELGGTEFFYTMEYIEGVPVNVYFGERGTARIQSVLTHLLGYLQELHARGFAFGDMKAGNVLVNPVTEEVRLVDFGGLTRFGEGVRQYTEWNDRGYWGAGSRKADPAYDLFAVAMLAIQLFGVKAEQKGPKHVLGIISRLENLPSGKVWCPVLLKALRGSYKSASQMQRDIRKIQQVKREKSYGTVFRNKIHAGLVREWDWSDWTVIGSAVICLFLFLRFLMVQ